MSTPFRRIPLTRAAATVLAVGLALRESFSFWTGHPYDFEVWLRTGYVVAHGTNPYLSFWPPVPGVSIAFQGGTLPSAAYPPFWPGLLGGIYHLWWAIGGGNRFALYFLIKQPPIAGDLVAAWLIYQLVARWNPDPRAAYAALALWALFPYDILVSAIWGQFDSILVAIVLALLLLRNPVQRNILDGIGIFVKWLTVIFLPLEFFRARGWRRGWAFLSLAVAGGLTAVAFAVAGWSFSGFTATTSSETQGGGGGMNVARFFTAPQVASAVSQIPGIYSVLPFLWIPAVILAGWAAARWVLHSAPSAELRALAWITTVFLLTRWGLNEQYMLYLFGLLIVDVYAFHPGRRALLAFTAGVTFVFLLVNNNLGIWFLSPISSSYWTYATNVDASSGVGVIRTDILYVLAGLVTITLVQVAVALYRDDPHPVPWVLAWRAQRLDPPAAP